MEILCITEVILVIDPRGAQLPAFDEGCVPYCFKSLASFRPKECEIFPTQFQT